MSGFVGLAVFAQFQAALAEIGPGERRLAECRQRHRQPDRISILRIAYLVLIDLYSDAGVGHGEQL